MKKLYIFFIYFFCCHLSLAATPVDLSLQPISFLTPYVTNQSEIRAAKIRESVDDDEILLLVQETYDGFSVWDATFNITTPVGINTNLRDLINNPDPKIKMNGIFFTNIRKDLEATPDYIFNYSYAQMLIAKVKKIFERDYGKLPLSKTRTSILVFMQKEMAHWSYFISFAVTPQHAPAFRTNYIIDALKFNIDKHWDS